MKKIVLLALLALFCINRIEAVFTRLIYTNSGCTGDYIGYLYYPSNSIPCTYVGCQKITDGFWGMENCTAKVVTEDDGSFSSYTISSISDCTDEYATVSIMADQCVAVVNNEYGLQVFKVSPCPTGTSITATVYNDTTCTNQILVSTIKSDCSAYTGIEMFNARINHCPTSATPLSVPVAPTSATPSQVTSPTINTPVKKSSGAVTAWTCLLGLMTLLIAL